ncbi:MAG: hypothetical protein ACI85O_001243 [Saprospiraceae bacterium]
MGIFCRGVGHLNPQKGRKVNLPENEAKVVSDTCF